VATEWLYVLSFVGALSLSLILVPIVRTFAVHRSFLDRPGVHKSHELPVPYLGGVAMVVAFSVAVAVGAFTLQGATFGDLQTLLRSWGRPSTQLVPLKELLFVLGAALTMSFVGLIDDLKGLKASLRLVVEVVVAISVIAFGIQFESPLPPLVNWLITVFWIVGISNAMNLLDNMDGLAAGVAGIAAASFFVLALIKEQPFVALLAIGLAGCTMGFLRSNFNPATIYMGDAGSLYLGFMLAYLGLQIRVDQGNFGEVLVPVVVLGVAILDTTLVVASRIARGVSPFQGGKDHLSHRLLRFELDVRRVVAVVLLIATMFGIQAVVISQTSEALGLLLLSSVLVSALMIVVLTTTRRTSNRARLSNVTELKKRAQ